MTNMSIGVGHNLAQANNVVLLDLWWNEATEDQAIARSYRIGQKNVVTVQRIVAKSSFDGKMMLLQDKKSKGINQIIDKVEENVKYVKSYIDVVHFTDSIQVEMEGLDAEHGRDCGS